MQKKRGQFSIEIIRCDGFVSMPATAQALYFQILASCDDEGFTSQLEMCKFMAKASDKDVEILVKREFIFQLGDDGDGNKTITVVKHWKMNNYFREGKADPSSFAERTNVFVKPNGNYTLDPSEGTPLATNKKQTSLSPNTNKIQTKNKQVTNEEQTNVSSCEAPTQTPAQTPTQAGHHNTSHTNTTQYITDTPNVVSNNPLQGITSQSNTTDEDEELPI